MFKGKDSDSKTIGDFMRIFSGESKPEQSPDEMVAILNAFAAFQNANVRGG